MKPEDRLLAALAGAARDEDRDALADSRWDALARGDLTPEERAELDALAAEDPALDGAPDLFAPLGPDAEDRFVKAIQAQLAAPAAAPPASETARPAAPPAASPAAPPPATRPAPAPASNVVSLEARRTRRAWVTGISTTLALAAGVSLWVITRPAPTAAPLPAYALLVTGGERDLRADLPAPVVLAPGARITMTLRPAEPAPGPLEARAFLVQGTAHIPLEAPPEVSPDGAVRLVTHVPPEAALAPGPAEIAVAIARRGAFDTGPATYDDLLRLGPALRWARSPVTYKNR